MKDTFWGGGGGGLTGWGTIIGCIFGTTIFGGYGITITLVLGGW